MVARLKDTIINLAKERDQLVNDLPEHQTQVLIQDRKRLTEILTITPSLRRWLYPEIYEQQESVEQEITQ